MYLSRGSAVEVMDADTGALVGYVPEFKRQHGVAFAPELGRGFVSDGTLAQVTTFRSQDAQDARRGQVRSRYRLHCLRRRQPSASLLTMNGDSHDTTVIDAASGSVIKTIDLGGSPEFAVADGKGMIYANLANRNQVAAIDARTLEVKSPSGLPRRQAARPPWRWTANTAVYSARAAIRKCWW